ncbi:MAG: ABC transporter substrate-binding protein, partial [Clostridiales bacterium]|nr:ABC transporter substrate-binding protein [Clostridiales bacterium]
SGINGWTVTLISRNCKDPQKAIEMVTYMMSEEGQKLIALGIEGEHYTMVDGKAVLTPTTQELIKNSYETYIEQVGANDAYWMLQDNLMQSQWMPDEDPVIQQMKDWCYPYTFYTGQYDVFFTDGSDADVANEKIVRIHSEMLPQLLLAPDQETFDRLWDEYCLTRKEAGIDIVLKESTRQMNENKRRLNMQ